jgi:hypothetical protein
LESRVCKGDWLFEYKKWNKVLRDNLNYKNYPDDGFFYMIPTKKDFNLSYSIKRSGFKEIKA